MGIAVLIGAAGWRVVQWLITQPRTPDPWDRQVAETIEEDDCPRVCYHCLSEHDAAAHFCPHCGVSVGVCTNLMPPLYLSSIGDVFRAGTEGTYRRSPFLTAGYFFAAFVAYALVAPLFFLVPVYWFKLLRSRFGPQNGNPAGSPPPVASSL
jgi:hypothetical protein